MTTDRVASGVGFKRYGSLALVGGNARRGHVVAGGPIADASSAVIRHLSSAGCRRRHA